jgi:periplasmic protein TonB
MHRRFSVAAISFIRYYTLVRADYTSYTGFFMLSLALHVALLPLALRKPFPTSPHFEPISVSFLPASKPVDSEKAITAPPPAARQRPAARANPTKRAPTTAKSRTPAKLPVELDKLPLPPQLASRAEPPPAIQERAAPAEPRAPTTVEEPRPAIPQSEASIVNRDSRQAAITKENLLPGRRDLISGQRPIPLNTSDPRYAHYTKIVQQWIEAQWEYPDLAKQHGLQGRVVVQFTIQQNGEVTLLELVRSSGSALLDEEAVRAIRAAAPFRPFPRSIQEPGLKIIAGFVYSDQRRAVSGTP